MRNNRQPPFQHRARPASFELRWVAACDINPEALKARADEFDIPGRYLSVNDLLSDPAVDAVVIATPPSFHLEPTVAALKAKKHVLVEKPIALNANEVQKMLDARGAGMVAACCSSRFRTTATAHRATEIMASKKLGKIRRLVCTDLEPPPKKLNETLYLYKPNWGGLGILGEWGCYDLDYMLGICGWSLTPRIVLADIQKLQTIYAKKHPPCNDAEIQVSAKFRFRSGVTLDYRRANYFAGEARNEWTIECEQGTLNLPMIGKPKPQLIVHRYTSSGIKKMIIEEDHNTLSMLLAGPVLDFIDAIFENRAPLTDLKQALIIQSMTDAVYDSAKSGQAVSVDNAKYFSSKSKSKQ